VHFSPTPWSRCGLLERYVPAFRDNDVDAEVLLKLTTFRRKNNRSKLLI
jgi:hypothetical protein